MAAFQEARRRSAASYDAAVRKWKSREEEEEGEGGEGGEKNQLPLFPRKPRPTPKLLVTSATADGALALLGALESGVDGVVLRTGDPKEVRALCAAVGEAAAARASSVSAFVEEKKNTGDDGDDRIQFEVGVVSSVSPAGMGDRVCVDVTVLLEPGEGLLVGSFAAAALLVHSEREGGKSETKSETNNSEEEEAYISPRPFRVNAGAVHSYVAVPRGRTAYLSELEAGSEVLVVRPPMSCNGEGGESLTTTTTTTTTTSTTAVVGRAKVERRPMTKVEVRLADGSTCSAILQNAETVRVVAPRAGGGGGRGSAASLPPPLLPLPPPTTTKQPPRRLAREDEEALRWAMDPPSSASSSSSKSRPPPEKLAEDDEETLDWVMGPSESSNSYPSSHPLSRSSSSPGALSATPTWSSTSSSSSDDEENNDGNDSDGAEELVEGPPRRPYLLPKNDSRAVAALRWLLGGGKRGGGKGDEEEDGGGAKTRSSFSSSSSSSPSSSKPSSPVFPCTKWDPRETKGWTTVAVTDLAPGQPVLVRRAAAARHTGIEIEESIVER